MGHSRRPQLLLSFLFLPAVTAFTQRVPPPVFTQRARYTNQGLANSFDSSEDAAPSRAAVGVTKKDKPQPSQRRNVRQVEKFTRLPFWPAWNGVFIFLVSKVLGDDAGAQLEDWMGGRVCPNFFRSEQTSSPFLMLVHHRHSFAPWDPFRLLQSTFFPEGFPAHPHRGMCLIDIERNEQPRKSSHFVYFPCYWQVSSLSHIF